MPPDNFFFHFVGSYYQLLIYEGSAPSKPICHDFGSVCLQIGSKEFEKLGQKGALLVHLAISKPKIDGFGARPL